LVKARAGLHWRLANLFLRVHWWEAAANAYGRALRIQPNDPSLQFQRAWSLLEVPHRRAEAIAAFDSLNKSAPSAFGYYLMACGLQQERRHEDAVQAFREVERLDPTVHGDFDYSYNYAKSLASLGRFEEATDRLENTVRLYPSDAEAWAFLGMMFASLGRWKDAVPCQERAMRFAPSAEHGLQLGETLLWLNRLDEAERVLRECLAIDPRSTDIKEDLALVLASQDRREEALALAQEICAVKQVAPSSRVALACVLSAAGRLSEALQEANRAAEASSSDPRTQVVLGSIHVEMNNGAAALAAFDRVADSLVESTERLPASLQVCCAAGRGNALSVLGRHEEAMSAFEEALRGDPEYFERSLEGRSHYDRSLRETHRSTPRESCPP
jgi:tetratricopeptide (TPR) repeat protein